MLVKIGLLWRADADEAAARARLLDRLRPLLAEFARLPVDLEHLPYDEDRAETARARRRDCDQIMVWVNPIQDGRTRAELDPLLSDAAAKGAVVSADPNVLARLRSKHVLHAARELPFGSDIEIRESPQKFASRFPLRLAALFVDCSSSRAAATAATAYGTSRSSTSPPSPPHDHPAAVRVEVRSGQATDGASDEMTLSDFSDLVAGRSPGLAASSTNRSRTVS